MRPPHRGGHERRHGGGLLRAGATAVALLLGLPGCAGTSFDGRTYRGDGFAFRIAALPPPWRPIEPGDAPLAFRDDEHDATVLVSARCGRDGDDVPLGALTQHLFLQFTERQIVLQEVVPFDRREAMHTRLGARLDGVAKHYDAWVLKKDGCVYDLVYLAPAASFPPGLPAFLALVKSFATVPSDAD
ncbi:MAG: hypothetical protein HY744_18815 [Deltaproteobacteria bacterium]|nr:hypothetical protein [Deltaproteobacteria bacterium]